MVAISSRSRLRSYFAKDMLSLLSLSGIALSIPSYWVPWPAKRKSLACWWVQNLVAIVLIIIIQSTIVIGQILSVQ
jgi:hypothetical protein